MNRRAVSAAVVALVTAWASQPATAQFGGFGGFDEPRASVVARFDKDGDKRLNDAERGAARAYLESQPSGFRRQRFGYASTQTARGRAMSPADLKPPFPSTPFNPV